MEPRDVTYVFDITMRSLQEYYHIDVFNFFIRQWPMGQLVAVDVTGKIIGYLTSARINGNKATITLFAVDPSHRNEGAGSRLLTEFRIRAAMDCRSHIQLEVRSDNETAIIFYEKRGFRKIDFLPGFYNLDGGDAIRMIAPSIPDA
jgi:ribosomal-protein-alanine N-acetyltransferase